MKKFLSVLVVAAIAASASVLACGEGAKIACPFGKVDGVEKAVNNLDNGVKIAWATKDAEMVKQLQTSVAAECEGKCEGCSKGVMTATGVDRKIENTDTGVVVILTSSNPELVKKVQDFGASQKGDCKGKCPMSKHGKKA